MKLKLHGTAYPIVVGKDATTKLMPFLKELNANRVVLISDKSLKQAKAKIKKQFTASKIELHEIDVVAGEALKDFESVYPLYGKLLELKADRDTVIIALGGGSIGDAIGFIASTYLRGIRWIGVPTTLLAQVDSSVGGKTGVNHAAGKNLIGSFHQPSLVICDTDFLKTLSKREIASGIGEIVKYSLTFDPKFFNYLSENLRSLLALEPKVTQKAIETSLQFKIDAVQEDEFDRKGVREVLNFGHTFGHALETLTRYETYQHGEAVVWGMRFATALSVVRGHLSECEGLKVDALLRKIPVPKLPKNLDFKLIRQAMKKDKKSSQNKVRFVLLKKIGKSISDHKVEEDALEKAFHRMTS